MSDENIIHVQVGGNPTDETVDKVGRKLRDTFPEKRLVISTDDMEMHELPALDDYADELAERIAERLE